MAITAGTASWVGTAPAETGQITALPGMTGNSAKILEGYGTVTGDGASSSFDINFIDGTKTIPFTPGGVICARSGGAATATIGVISCVATNAKVTVTTTAAVNAATYTVAFRLLP